MTSSPISLSLETAKTFPREGSANQLEIQGTFAKFAAASSTSFNPAMDREMSMAHENTLG